eukprot:4405987-Ditylum_brightwellii.AAC.1
MYACPNQVIPSFHPWSFQPPLSLSSSRSSQPNMLCVPMAYPMGICLHGMQSMLSMAMTYPYVPQDYSEKEKKKKQENKHCRLQQRRK